MITVLKIVYQQIQNPKNNNSTGSSGGVANKHLHTRKTPDNASLNHFITNKYSWIHNMCSHTTLRVQVSNTRIYKTIQQREISVVDLTYYVILKNDSMRLVS